MDTNLEFNTAVVQFLENNASLFWWLAIASAVTFIVTLVVVPWFLIRIPPDYFVRHGADNTPLHHVRDGKKLLLIIGRNMLGHVFIVAGIILLVLPGQGILTIVVGIMLADFPGKRNFVRWIVARPSVFRSVNWLRRRAGRAPLTS